VVIFTCRINYLGLFLLYLFDLSAAIARIMMVENTRAIGSKSGFNNVHKIKANSLNNFKKNKKSAMSV
jgi:hypothetical protein